MSTRSWSDFSRKSTRLLGVTKNEISFFAVSSNKNKKIGIFSRILLFFHFRRLKFFSVVFLQRPKMTQVEPAVIDNAMLQTAVEVSIFIFLWKIVDFAISFMILGKWNFFSGARPCWRSGKNRQIGRFSLSVSQRVAFGFSKYFENRKFMAICWPYQAAARQ